MPSLDESIAAGASPVVAILRGVRPEEAVAVGAALVSAGVSLIEVPLNSPQPFDSIARLVDALGSRATIGAGTVLDCAEVAELARIGAHLVVSPNCDPAVIAASLAAGITPLPGVMTPSEAFGAVKAGANRVKLFPAGSMSPAHCRALLEVLPAGTGIWAVGGIDSGNLGSWFDAGCEGIGLGGSLYRPGYTPDEVRTKAETITAALQARH
jgi:2-dehydro-3-deoxyphosphogalactonate aldolase